VSTTVKVIGGPELTARLANTEARVRLISADIDAELAMMWGVVVPLTPVGVTSALRGHWIADPVSIEGTSIIGVLGNPESYADVMEDGRRAGAPPPPSDAIALWVERKMGPDVSPFVVARSIGRKGIKGRKMLATAEATTLPAREQIRAATFSRLLEESG
jgi:hypothetical protein